MLLPKTRRRRLWQNIVAHIVKSGMKTPCCSLNFNVGVWFEQSLFLIFPLPTIKKTSFYPSYALTADEKFQWQKLRRSDEVLMAFWKLLCTALSTSSCNGELSQQNMRRSGFGGMKSMAGNRKLLARVGPGKLKNGEWGGVFLFSYSPRFKNLYKDVKIFSSICMPPPPFPLIFFSFFCCCW